MTIRKIYALMCIAASLSSPAQAETLASVPCGDEARVVMRAEGSVISAAIEGPHGTAYAAYERVGVEGEVGALRRARKGFERFMRLCGGGR